jgi:hypothetical protein
MFGCADAALRVAIMPHNSSRLAKIVHGSLETLFAKRVAVERTVRTKRRPL